ncbi:hypothetical protein VNI00_011104 [Paramarasmius palmivorus]|uniref:protein-tyrosine-phosphatase n=1 Tax=Paramarasmius palmivorus TaxID=297713 RepID=A0AAW0CED6_9AGAR
MSAGVKPKSFRSRMGAVMRRSSSLVTLGTANNRLNSLDPSLPQAQKKSDDFSNKLPTSDVTAAAVGTIDSVPSPIAESPIREAPNPITEATAYDPAAVEDTGALKYMESGGADPTLSASQAISNSDVESSKDNIEPETLHSGCDSEVLPERPISYGDQSAQDSLDISAAGGQTIGAIVPSTPNSIGESHTREAAATKDAVATKHLEPGEPELASPPSQTILTPKLERSSCVIDAQASQPKADLEVPAERPITPGASQEPTSACASESAVEPKGISRTGKSLQDNGSVESLSKLPHSSAHTSPRKSLSRMSAMTRRSSSTLLFSAASDPRSHSQGPPSPHPDLLASAADANSPDTGHGHPITAIEAQDAAIDLHDTFVSQTILAFKVETPRIDDTETHALHPGQHIAPNVTKEAAGSNTSESAHEPKERLLPKGGNVETERAREVSSSHSPIPKTDMGTQERKPKLLRSRMGTMMRRTSSSFLLGQANVNGRSHSPEPHPDSALSASNANSSNSRPSIDTAAPFEHSSVPNPIAESPMREAIASPTKPELTNGHNLTEYPSIISPPNSASADGLLRGEKDSGSPSVPYADGPVEILPGVWLGSEDNAHDIPTLLKNGIRSILNVAKEVASPFESAATPAQHLRSAVSTPNTANPTYYPPHPPSGRPGMYHLKLQWSHGQRDLVEDGFPSAMKFIDAAQQRGEGILVHCQSGISRSAALVIALVMRAAADRSPNGPSGVWALKGMQDAYDFVRDKSKMIGPNMSLIYQLLEYEKRLKESRGSPSSGTDEKAREAPSLLSPALKTDMGRKLLRPRLGAAVRRPLSSFVLPVPSFASPISDSSSVSGEETVLLQPGISHSPTKADQPYAQLHQPDAMVPPQSRSESTSPQEANAIIHNTSKSDGDIILELQNSNHLSAKVPGIANSASYKARLRILQLLLDNETAYRKLLDQQGAIARSSLDWLQQASLLCSAFSSCCHAN